MGDEIEFSEKQKNGIYVEYLRPLKLKIAQILLYDTKKAAEFLNKYNDMIENTEDNEIELLKKITDLEFEIREYEQGEGKRKTIEDKSKIIITEISEMIENSEKLNVEEFEKRLKTLVENYKENFSNYSFKEKDGIDEKVYELQAELILKKVQQNDLDKIEIDQEDEIGLMIYLNKEINRLQLTENSHVKDCVQKLKYSLMSGIDAVQNIETWKILRDAQNEEKQKEEIVPKSNELMVTDKFEDNRGIIRKIIERFLKKTPETLTDSNLTKITIDWLAEHVSQNMLEDWEKESEKEKNIQGNTKKYLPDAKAFVCDYFRKIYNQEKYNANINDDGVEKTIIVEKGKKGERWYPGPKKVMADKYCPSTNIKVIASKIEIDMDRIIKAMWGDDWYYEYFSKEKHFFSTPEQNINLIGYAEMLDSIVGTNYRNRMLHIYERAITTEDIDELNNSKLFGIIEDSFYKIEREYKERSFNIFAQDEAKRNSFYKQNSFISGLKVDLENQKENEIENKIQDKQEEIMKNNSEPRE